MSQQLIPFQYQGHLLRVEADAHGEPLFHANDLCALLGYRNPRDAVRRHVEADDLVKREVTDSMGRTQMANWIREPGMWALVLGSETEQSRAVKRWVTAEVLPTIRKTGGYGRPAEPEKLTIEVTKDEYIALLEARAGVSLLARPQPSARPRPWTPEEDRQLLELYTRGVGPTEIGRRLGRTYNAVRGRLQRLNAQPSLPLEGGAA